MHEILEQLCEDHFHMTGYLAKMEHQLMGLIENFSVDMDEMRAVIDYMVETPDCTHHPVEDVIFQRLGERDRDAHHVVSNLHKEHEKLRLLGSTFLHQLELVAIDGLVLRVQLIETGNAYLSLLRDHMSEEESVVFPWADRCLLDEDWRFVSRFASARRPVDNQSDPRTKTVTPD